MSRWECVPKPCPGGDAIFVDHAQGAESHVARVVMLAEGKGMPAVEPTDLRVHAIGRATNRSI